MGWTIEERFLKSSLVWDVIWFISNLDLFFTFVNREKKILYNCYTIANLDISIYACVARRKVNHYTLTYLTLNKQRHGFGNGTINPFSNTLLILDQEVEIWISTIDYIFKPFIKSYTFIASAVGASFMSTQISCRMNWYNGEWG